MKNSLLSHIATNFISDYENVANSSIAYLLNQYDSARQALRNILEIESVPDYYVTELSTDNNGRPDITGLESDGSKSIIIEGKFWANLTSNQPNNYLKELSDNGKLLFVAPESRLSSLQNQIQVRIGEADDRVKVISWRAFIEAVELENQKSLNPNLLSDTFQLKELCEQMDREGMPPLSMSDLDPMNGRVSYQFSDLIDECNRLLRNWQESDFKGLKTTAMKGLYGFYFKAFNSSCYLCLSHQDWYTKESHTPIWLRLMDSDFKQSKQIYVKLKGLDDRNTYLEENYTSYAIQLKPGMDRNEVIECIVFKVKEILTFVNSNDTD